jgi:hypothetical protein
MRMVIANRSNLDDLTARRMNQRFRCFIILAMAGILSSCGLFDSGIEWRGGPYALLWIDTSENVSICRELADDNWIGRVDSTVFAVGWDGRYLVAKQHPDGDRSKTNYFIVDSRNDTPYVDPTKVVTGPLTALEFQRKTIEMKLPKFSKVLKSLQ